jgi:hypothetical protein
MPTTYQTGSNAQMVCKKQTGLGVAASGAGANGCASRAAVA